MENSKKSAYPLGVHTSNANAGLTKREYFAAMAMQGLLANPRLSDLQTMERFNGKTVGESLAIISIEYADELLKQLEQ